jgi:hypothetical protein
MVGRIEYQPTTLQASHFDRSEARQGFRSSTVTFTGSKQRKTAAGTHEKTTSSNVSVKSKDLQSPATRGPKDLSTPAGHAIEMYSKKDLVGRE